MYAQASRVKIPISPAEQSAAVPLVLNGGTGRTPVRAEHTAVSRQWLKARLAGGTLVEEDAGVGRHLLFRLGFALRACEDRDQIHGPYLRVATREHLSITGFNGSRPVPGTDS
jgi:hypothetical protein